ncbi:MAG: DALR anticodon-binding domain-containing protein, partial [Aeromonas veronii]
TRQSRLLLCAATAKVLKLGLGVLGIHTLERM